MTEDQRQAVASWLEDLADKVEQDEPYAAVTIAQLRGAAEMVSVIEDDQDPEGGKLNLAV